MNEQEELKIKNELLKFIKSNFVYEGDPELVENKVYDLTDKLYTMFRKFRGDSIDDSPLQSGKVMSE